MNNNVNILLEICKNLTEQHIIEACTKYEKELIKDYDTEINYIEYNNKRFRLKPTIRIANDEFLNNEIKLNSDKYKQNGEIFLTADNFIDFFNIKFKNTKHIKLISTKNDVKYFLCCQGKNYEKEHKEGILTADLSKQYRILDRLKVGDIVFNYSEAEIKSISTVLEVCKKNNNARIVKVKYKDLDKPITLEHIRNLLKDKDKDFANPFVFQKGNWRAKLKGYIHYMKKDLVDLIIDKNKYNEILDNNKNDNKGKDMTKPPLNQILYGPPGTGKTYNTVVEAIKILKEDLYEEYEAEKISYENLKTEFNELRKQGRIEFVTFHQSYSYEEFVEGIKPDIESWETSAENLKYKGANGIFKKICNDADSKFTTKDFDNIYNKFLEEISNTDGIFKLTTKKYKKTFGLKVNNNDNLNIYMGEELIKQGSLTKENIKAHFLNARKRFDWANYYDSVVEYLETKYNLKKENVGTQPYVLVIDEINRGNISKIFGELITLIEEDKRENLSVKLPYSQEEFTVPNNLYIIGTMNTSDRSIASIDIALRRRFKFKEMMPEIDLVADFKCNFQECFKTLNERISILLDRDHQIGHSYFIKEKHKDLGTEELKEIWFDSIIPLLNEYFYGDWDKLQAILGEAKADESSFIKKQTINKTTFAKEIDICETESFDFNLKCDFNLAMKNAFGDKFTIGETNAQ